MEKELIQIFLSECQEEIQYWPWPFQVSSFVLLFNPKSIRLSIYKSYILLLMWFLLMANKQNGWKYDWVDPLGTPSKDNQGIKSQIIFMGPFF
jgi:hypothetical protein